MKFELQTENEELIEEIRIGSIANGELPIREFYEIFSQISAENGDTPDLQYCPILKEESPGYRIDGYAFNFLESEGIESGELFIAVCDFRQDRELTAVNGIDVDRAVNGVVRFIKSASEKKFLIVAEQSSPAYQLAVLLHQYISRIRRLRIVLFTNGHLRIRKNKIESRELGDISIHVNVLDIERYSKIASLGREPIEVDFLNDLGGVIECLPASNNNEKCTSYLFAIPGDVLAHIFEAYGNRLLEQNVRTFLQAKTNVNKGIINTIAKEPSMFFAYNNGITSTASQVVTVRLPNGALAISSIKDFQIVNGGQTTASILYARDELKLDLSSVHVQVKLSVVEEEQLGNVVPKISEYANTQNKVSLADLASNSPVQIKIERLSKEIQTPQKAGELYSSKWFYERARGQYKSLFSYKTKAEKNKLEITYPKSQLITKTDLAKYDLSFAGQPHHVSEGAQKCFSRYIQNLANADLLTINETWFRRNVAKAILFTRLDRDVQQADWYKDDRGYKSQIVTYTIAACANGFRNKGLEIDLDRIWREQNVMSGLAQWMLNEAYKVSKILKNPPSNVRNISEFAKREFCWKNHVMNCSGNLNESVVQFGISAIDFAEEAKQGRKLDSANRELDFDIAVLKLVNMAPDLIVMAEKSGFASPKNISALKKIASGNVFALTMAEKNAVKYLLNRLEVEI